MPQRHRSQRSRRAALVMSLRAEGWTWVQIAGRIAGEDGVNMRVAFRLAHGWSQAHVAQLWNTRWPGQGGRAGVTDKTISYWETWPQSGHEPSLRTLKRLAQLYQCDVGDLIDEGKYGHLDEMQQCDSQDRNGLASHVAGVALPAQTNTVSRVSSLSASPPGDFAPLALVLSDDSPPATARRYSVSLERLLQLAREQGGSPLQREALYEQLMQFLVTWADNMKRRDLLRILGWAATAAASAPLFPGLDPEEQEQIVGVLGSRDRIDGAVISYIESVLFAAMRQDDALGPQAALDTVLAQRNLVRAVLPECPSSLRPRLLSLFGNLSRFAGWLSFDLNDLESAAHYYEHARTAAHAAENTELGVFVLCNLSHLATWRGQPRLGIDHAVAAHAWAEEIGDRLLRAYVADVAARAYATAGMTRRCLQALDSIPGDLGTDAHTPATSFAYFYGPGEFASTQAQCMLLLHDAPQAIECAQAALTQLDSSFVRNRAFGTLFLSDAYVEYGEIPEASKAVGDAAELTARNQSVRLVRQLGRARNQLSPWGQTRAVRELDERLAAYGWGRSSMT